MLRKWILLVLLSLLLTLTPVPSWSQTTNLINAEKADVVLDGNKLFQIRGVSNLTASERAKFVNQSLEQVVRSPSPVNVQIVQKNEQTVIENKTTETHLITVTSSDLSSASDVLNQAYVWQEQIKLALRRGQLERTPNYQRKAGIFTVVVLVIAIAIHIILQFFGKLVTRNLLSLLGKPTSSLHPWEKPTKLFLQLALLGMQAGLWIAVFYYVTDVFPEPRSWRYQVLNFLNSPVIALGESKYSAIDLIFLLALTIIFWLVVKALTRLFKLYILGKTGIETGAQDVIAILSQYIVTFLGLIVLWQIWGLDVGSLAILASVLGVGIGFGLQNITNNFISGLIITIERPIQEGDFVDVGGLVGTVKHISARSTKIITLDRVAIIVPNSRFLESEVINWTHSDPISRLHIPVGVAYGSDIDKVKSALLTAANSHPDVLLRPRPEVLFIEFGDSSLNFELMVWTGEPKKQFLLKSDLNYRIEKSLRRYDIEVPFPQRDINVRSPYLENLVNGVMHKYNLTSFNSPDDQSEAKKQPQPTSSLDPVSLQTLPPDLVPLENRISAVEIEKIVDSMRGEDGIEIKDRRYRLNIYPNCFIGSEAVDWLIENQNWTREEAIEFGQLLMQRGVIHHVTSTHQFEDAYFFYRFYGS